MELCHLSALRIKTPNFVKIVQKFQLFNINFFVKIGKLIPIANFYKIKKKWRVIKAAILKN